MSGLLPIVCDNCGAKYKLPESFTGSQSKCQKCGSVIDVDAQRQQAGPANAAAKPATGARPAVARTAESPRPAERAARSRPGDPPAARSAGRERAGRGRRDAPAKKSSTPVLLGGIGLLVAIGVIAWLLSR